jgi:hypothetical protein
MLLTLNSFIAVKPDGVQVRLASSVMEILERAIIDTYLSVVLSARSSAALRREGTKTAHRTNGRGSDIL